MTTKIELKTTWEIRHSDPAFPGQVVIRTLSAGLPTVQIMTFTREVFLDFADQIGGVADAIRRGDV
jgi:hypothetical protein